MKIEVDPLGGVVFTCEIEEVFTRENRGGSAQHTTRAGGGGGGDSLYS